MKPPFYRLTAKCSNGGCQTDTFVKEVKQVSFVSTSGQLQTKTDLVCPGCRRWAKIIKLEEVTA